MTSAEEQAKRCLEKNTDSALNDSWYLPVDLETRIIAAIESARTESWNAAVEACATNIEKAGGFDHNDRTYVGNVVRAIVDDIRALSTAKAEAAKAE